MSESWKDMPSHVVDAKLQLLQAEIVGQHHDNRLADSIAETAEMTLRRERERNDWELAGPSYQRIYHFTDSIDGKSVGSAIDTISRWDWMDTQNGDEDPYTLVICSPGGEIIPGFQLYSFLCSIAQKRQLTIIAAGICASMATIIHQAASDDRRFIEPGTTYLLHELSAGTAGRLDSISDTTEYFRKLNDSLREIYSDRSGMSVEDLKSAVERRECYLTPDEVVDWGLADKIAYSNGGVPS